ncbi:DUF1800 domain-containing protein [Parasphingorhabdus sp. DH2-15]|uniref:DUF1800 domain-containing protein n=1 Tax=Parasphingorhabdus sp. DH2-15 TaxID=3444112 RepID=UPI003F68849B
MIAAEIAENRFGLGAVGRASTVRDAKMALKRQLRDFIARPPAIVAVPDAKTISRMTGEYLNGLREQGIIGKAVIDDSNVTAAQKRKRATEVQKHARKFFGTSGRDFYAQSVAARISTAVSSQTPFAERLVHFWSNHFAISIDKSPIQSFAGSHEFEGVRPYIMGKFSDLVKAAALHPGMLVYLDQVQSVGPNSLLGRLTNTPRRKRKIGLNENLAREILELHTLGVNGGYSQSDVTAFANAMTGWTVTGLSRGPVGRYVKADNSYGETIFSDALHQQGRVVVMGKNYAASGKLQSLNIIDDIARHPATAEHIAGKLAQHFYGDNPPDSLKRRLREDFMRTGGDLTSLYETLVDSPELWEEPVRKFKTPWEWTISIARAFPDRELYRNKPLNFLRKMNNPPWRPGSPAGYGDRDVDWVSPDALYQRIQFANRIAHGLRDLTDVEKIAEGLLPASLSMTTRLELQRAESPRQALALLMISPEFLRR